MILFWFSINYLQIKISFMTIKLIKIIAHCLPLKHLLITVLNSFKQYKT